MMENKRKKLKAQTLERYTAVQAWNAALLRSESYRYECDGIYIDCGEHFEFYAGHHDYDCAVRALIGMGAVDFSGNHSRNLLHLM
jgi:hypothetical protein